MSRSPDFGLQSSLLPYGEDGWWIDLCLPDTPTRVRETVRAGDALRRVFPQADISVAAGVIALWYAPLPREDAVRAALRELPEADTDVREHRVPVVYDGLDVGPTAAALGLSPEALIDLHSASAYQVQLLGFLPGFAYLGPLPPRLRLGRRSTPRPRVDAGSLAMAAGYTGIYPFDSPGGWHLLGRALGAKCFDPHRESPFLFEIGDQVRFERVSPSDAPPEPRVLDISITLRAERRPHLVIEQAPPLACLEDEGRVGLLGRGLPRSGPVDAERFDSVQRALHNSASSAALEFAGGRLSFRAFGRPLLAWDGQPPLRAAEGELFELAAGRAPRYLGVEGGFEADRVLGSASTHVVAGLGGLGGRNARRGDRLLVANTNAARPSPPESTDQGASGSKEGVPSIHLAPGPHAARFSARAWETLLTNSYVPAALWDRTGTRLDGPRLEAPEPLDASVPVTRGVMQIPPSGQPIVLGPDHPVSGGYPVIAVVRKASLSALARADGPVRFVLDTASLP